MSSLENLSHPDLWIEGRGIRRITVEELFGQFSYTLDQSALTPPNHSSRLILLYGNNGAGKTTILRILFYLLSSVDKVGHKAKIKKFRFLTFSVLFANGTKVQINRQSYKEEGFEVEITKHGDSIAKVDYFRSDPPQMLEGLTEERHIARHITMFELEQKREAEHKAVLENLRLLDAGMLFVTDRRSTLTTLPNLRNMNSRTRRARLLDSESDDPDDHAMISLSGAVDQIGSWATRQAFSGSAQGEDDVNTVYAKIVDQLAHQTRQSESIETDLQVLINDIVILERRSHEFARFGFTRRLAAGPLITPLSTMSISAQRTAVEVLRPYVDGLKARYDALEPIMLQLSQFASVLRSFYSTKRVSLNVRQGLRITANNEVLDPSMLSSGEGQLLYILASTLMAKEQASLFIIDEPEISLNIRWQRELLRSLLEITRGTKIQFLMATHSIELLTRYNQFVLDLSTPEDERTSKENH
jgi:ABC-type cobalamin/Fe3+-siderophores transport system ATPase subunit